MKFSGCCCCCLPLSFGPFKFSAQRIHLMPTLARLCSIKFLIKKLFMWYWNWNGSSSLSFLRVCNGYEDPKGDTHEHEHEIQRSTKLKTLLFIQFGLSYQSPFLNDSNSFFIKEFIQKNNLRFDGQNNLIQCAAQNWLTWFGTESVRSEIGIVTQRLPVSVEKLGWYRDGTQSIQLLESKYQITRYRRCKILETTKTKSIWSIFDLIENRRGPNLYFWW